jgi:hypothetical protein
MLVNILDWHEVATLNAAYAAADGQAFTFPLPWIVWVWGGSGGTSVDYIQRTWLLFLGTLTMTSLILLKA